MFSPMPLHLSDSAQMLQDVVRDFARKEIAPIAAKTDEENLFIQAKEDTEFVIVITG